jgi:hypothetical protein
LVSLLRLRRANADAATAADADADPHTAADAVAVSAPGSRRCLTLAPSTAWALSSSSCAGVVAIITEAAAIKAILEHLGLPTTGPPVPPARSRVQPDPWAWQDDVATLQ